MSQGSRGNELTLSPSFFLGGKGDFAVYLPRDIMKLRPLEIRFLIGRRKWQEMGLCCQAEGSRPSINLVIDDQSDEQIPLGRDAGKQGRFSPNQFTPEHSSLLSADPPTACCCHVPLVNSQALFVIRFLFFSSSLV